MKIIFFMLLLCIESCQIGGTQKAVNAPSTSELENSYDKYCESFNIALQGVFTTTALDGTMTWSGGLKGSVDIDGVDYNSMTCTYDVTNCENGEIAMVCDGGAYNTVISLFSRDSIKVGPLVYVRVK